MVCETCSWTLCHFHWELYSVAFYLGIILEVVSQGFVSHSTCNVNKPLFTGILSVSACVMWMCLKKWDFCMSFKWMSSLHMEASLALGFAVDSRCFWDNVSHLWWRASHRSLFTLSGGESHPWCHHGVDELTESSSDWAMQPAGQSRCGHARLPGSQWPVSKSAALFQLMILHIISDCTLSTPHHVFDSSKHGSNKKLGGGGKRITQGC